MTGGALLGVPASPRSLETPLAKPSDNTAEQALTEDAVASARLDRILNLLAWGSLALILAVMMTGCSSIPLNDQVWGPSHVPTNYFRAEGVLSAGVKSVAVMPLLVPPDVAEEAVEVMEPALHEELLRTTIAEWRFLTPEELRRATGRKSWTPEEKLPKDLMVTLKERFGCDAVLFPQLTRYHPFRPVTLGWRFKLVDCQDARLLWAADETFDSGVAAIAAAARRHYQRNVHSPSTLEDSRMVLQSPRYFAHYSIQALLETLPGR